MTSLHSCVGHYNSLVPQAQPMLCVHGTCLSFNKNRHLNLHEQEYLKACLHGGGGPQVGEVTRLAVVEKWSAFTCKVTTPGSRGDVTRRCCKCNMNSTPARQVTPP